MARLTQSYNFRAVGPRLSTSGQPTEAQLRAAAAEGCEVIINLALHDDPRYSLPDEAGLVEGLGMVYVHIPVRFDAPTQADLLAFFEAMDIHRTRKIHIHCAANLRVTAFLGLYQTLRQGRSATDAFATMRSVWQPDAVWSSFISDMLGRHTHPHTP